MTMLERGVRQRESVLRECVCGVLSRVGARVPRACVGPRVW